MKRLLQRVLDNGTFNRTIAGLADILGFGKKKEVSGKVISSVKDLSPFTSHFSPANPPQPSLEKGGRKAAFTLAEVLITLGIIGVVAAITMPSLIHKSQNKALETRFKKSYSIASQVLFKTKEDIGVENLALYCANLQDGQYVNNRECQDTFFENAFANNKQFVSVDRYSFKTYNNKQIPNIGPALAGLANGLVYTGIMADGSFLNVHIIEGRMIVSIDTNGNKGPKKLGHDIFIFSVSSKNTLEAFGIPLVTTDEELENMTFNEPYQKARYGTPCNLTSSQEANGLGCAYYALRNECPYDSSKQYFECLP